MAPDARQRRLDRLFGRDVRLYDLQLPLERRALRAAADLAGPVEGARVLDLGTGTGGMAAALAARGRPAELVLCDRLPAMLRRARTRTERAAPGVPVRTLVADARAVPLPDAHFDLVTAAFLVHLLSRPDARRVLGEVRRLLAPGGRAVVLDHAAPDTPAGRLYSRLWGLARLLPGTAQGPQGDLRPLAAAAGLTVRASRSVPGVYWSHAIALERSPSATEASPPGNTGGAARP